MSTYLPQDVRDGLDAARIARLRKGNRLRVVVGGDSWPLLRLWRTGFSVEAEKVPSLRGLVDVYDGATHLYQCLIVASEEEAGEMRYEFKRNTAAHDKAPLDHFRDPEAPIALLPR
ncbi:MAG: hypothetical protein CML66_20230 [Rhodobacteraceae bacterium]|nr:hypothetical protein [Paracoccaceae bacterium]MAY46882.1 hypothetical protein [Paracoccaceae bacterium]QEW22237.1 hypothetical protein LA6_004454 [Marinibacterium anthonyi]